jgi:hypothetical protein
MSRAVYRFAEWTIGPERDEEGHLRAPVREVQCVTCEEMSEPSREPDRTDRWALRHAGLTGHRSYREITTAHLTVHPAPTNPLYEQEAASASR